MSSLHSRWKLSIVFRSAFSFMNLTATRCPRHVASWMRALWPAPMTSPIVISDSSMSHLALPSARRAGSAVSSGSLSLPLSLPLPLPLEPGWCCSELTGTGVAPMTVVMKPASGGNSGLPVVGESRPEGSCPAAPRDADGTPADSSEDDEDEEEYDEDDDEDEEENDDDAAGCAAT